MSKGERGKEREGGSKGDHINTAPVTWDALSNILQLLIEKSCSKASPKTCL